jgi:hypothetical protein
VPDQARRSLLEADLRALTHELDAELGDLDLSAAVTRRIRPAPARDAAHTGRLRRRLAVALAATAAIVAATAAVPSARAAVTNFLDVGVVRVHREPAPGPVSPTTDLQLGDRTTLAEARAQFPVVTPSAGGLGTPDEVWLTRVGGGGVSLVYGAGPGLPPAEHTGVGLLVQEFSGDGQGAVNKYVTNEARAQSVTINGDRGVFISGGDHTIYYDAPDGAEVHEGGRLVGNALIFQRGPLTIRLEGDLPQGRMVAIAESLR